MSSRYNSGRPFLILAFACAIVVVDTNSQASVSKSQLTPRNPIDAPSSLSARENRKVGRVIIERTPNFGNALVLNVRIDGREVANVVWDHRYDGFVSAGHHVLTVQAVPRSDFRRPSSMRLTVEPGHTYIFTAVWESDRVVLRRGGRLKSGKAHTPRN
jgi:hypothetical protein